VLVALVGLVARVVYILLVRDRPLFADSLGYHYRAQLLADGEGFVLPAREMFGAATNPPDGAVPPLWSLFLAVPAEIGLRSVLQQQLVSCLVGGATIFMSGLAGRAAFGRRVGLIAAAIVAIYPNIWIYERELFSEPLAMLGVAMTIWIAYRFLANPSGAWTVALGAVVGLLALTRAEQLALVSLLVVPLIFSRRRLAWSRRVAWVALAGAMCVLLIAPWTLYNADRFEEPVLITNGAGQVLRAGNCDVTYSGKYLGYTHLELGERTGPEGCSILDDEFADDQSLVDRQLRDAAFEYMGDHLSRVPVVSAARIGRTFNLFRPFQQVHFEAERLSPLWVARVGLFSFWVLAPLAVLGAIVARRRRVPSYPILAFFGVVLLAVAFTIGAVRYRAPAEVPLVLLAAVGIDHLLLRLRHAADRPGEPQDTQQ
jgi:4-amino-4-deoxy-L-arabinose transferase-like glycosyltransferase